MKVKKEYEKPLIEYFDLRTEEGIATTGSKCKKDSSDSEGIYTVFCY